MAKLIVPRHTADLDYIIPALEVYYEATDWLDTARYKDLLVSKLKKNEKETERNSDETHYTKCSEIPRYFGLLERKESGKSKSDVRITATGKNFYTAYKKGDFNTIHSIIVDALENVIFGRNNEGCGSDTDVEAPKAVVVSALLLDGISNKEAAYILGELLNGVDLANVALKVKYIRINKEKTPSSSVTSDIKFIPFLRRINFFSENADGLVTVAPDVFEKYKDRLVNLSITNSVDSSIEYEADETLDRQIDSTVKDTFASYLAALRTKPFMLLAGISGTGKSRIVRELAFKSCPPELQDEYATTPGNYLMVEVKPNWHDSTEILGYYSNISQSYQHTKFVKFLVKAMMFPNVPFFVCLDEMNLAPVEQYFAEFLSVLETRKKGENGITTGVLVGPEAFASIRNAEAGNGYVAKYLCPELNINIPYHIYKNPSLAKVGLTLPDNVFIIGTVNMDDTTHQFSRKVIDRAMTIEMNGEDLNKMFGGSSALQYPADDQIMPLSEFQPKYVNADEVMEEHPEAAETLQTELVAKLEAINACLKNTPFQVSYRVLNEMCIYAGVMLDDGKEVNEAIAAAVDQITLMKILPRIEGDEDMFVADNENKLELQQKDNENKLMQLQKCFAEKSASYKKLEEMITRLKSSSFTRFWP